MTSYEELPRRLSYEELAVSLEHFLADWNGDGPLWVFGYGSLIWRPDLSFDERRPARVHGYHRRLCLWSRINRGTPQCPGLVAGLDRGGSCAGVVYRVPAAAVRGQFMQLWQREMMTNSYHPRHLDCRLEDGAIVSAVAFVVRRDAPNYAGRLDDAAAAGATEPASSTSSTRCAHCARTASSIRTWSGSRGMQASTVRSGALCQPLSDL